MFLAETELITGGVSMYPTLETIRQLAQTKEYRRIPLCRELYADRYTPVEVMRILRKASRHCYLLESASQTEVWGRYSFLGYEPSMEITCTDGTLKIRTTDAEGKTEETVRHSLPWAFFSCGDYFGICGITGAGFCGDSGD